MRITSVRAGAAAAALGAIAFGAAAAPSERAGANALPDDGRLVFDVYRNGGRFGSHIVRFNEGPDGLEVAVDIDLRVGVGPLTVFRYTHDIRELWRDGELVALEARTRKDGRDYELTVARNGDGVLEVRGADYRGAAEAATVPTSYWNMRLLERDAMLNTETGELMDIAVTELGFEMVDAAGEQVRATRYRVDGGPIPLEILYDDEGRWVGMAFTARGSEISYQLVDG